LREMHRDQWLPMPRLRRLQARRLRALLECAQARVPYYTELFRDLRFDARKIHDPDQLRELPFLTKQIIRENLPRLRNKDARRVKRFSTGGSTGAPVTFFLGSARVSSDIAARIRAEGWFGIKFTDPEFAIWGSPLEINKQERVRSFRDWLLQTRLLSAFEMDSPTMTRYLDEIESRGCCRIFGYPSSIVLLCEHADREKRDLRRLGIKGVFVTAEYLHDKWRARIENSFGCRVANGYGGRDSGFVAHECPAGGMHITADRLIVEIVDEHGVVQPPGVPGEIVVTNLDTPEMPFVRYRTGDIGVLSDQRCSCGRTLPLFERIDGRKTDFVVAPDGRMLHGLSLIYVLREITGISAFRITQKELTNFQIELVCNSQYEIVSESRIRKEFHQRLRAAVSVEIRYLESIPTTMSGKMRYVSSEVSPPPNVSWQASPEVLLC